MKYNKLISLIKESIINEVWGQKIETPLNTIEGMCADVCRDVNDVNFMDKSEVFEIIMKVQKLNLSAYKWLDSDVPPTKDEKLDHLQKIINQEIYLTKNYAIKSFVRFYIEHGMDDLVKLRGHSIFFLNPFQPTKKCIFHLLPNDAKQIFNMMRFKHNYRKYFDKN